MAKMSREEAAERRAQELEEARAIKDSFSININDVFDKYQRVCAGGPRTATAAPRRDQFIDNDPRYNIPGAEGAGQKEHIDWDNSFLARMGYAPKQQKVAQAQGAALPPPLAAMHGGHNRVSIAMAERNAAKSLAAFGPIVHELQKFAFSDDDQDRLEQMAEVAAAVKGALHKLAKKEVAQNTKKLYDNLEKYFITESGVQAVYKVADVNVVANIDGEFRGDEVIGCEQEGTDVIVEVGRPSAQGDGSVDLVTQNYNIQIEVVR